MQASGGAVPGALGADYAMTLGVQATIAVYPTPEQIQTLLAEATIAVGTEEELAAAAGSKDVADGVATLFEHGLCLPSGSALTEDDQRRVVETLRAA